MAEVGFRGGVWCGIRITRDMSQLTLSKQLFHVHQGYRAFIFSLLALKAFSLWFDCVLIGPSFFNEAYGNLKESHKLERDNCAIGKFWDHCCPTGFLQADHPGRCKNPVGIYGDDCRYNKTGEKLVAINFNCILQEPRSIWMGLNRIFDVFVTFFWLMVDGSSTLATIPTKHIDRPIRPGYV